MQWKAYFISVVLLGAFIGMMFYGPDFRNIFQKGYSGQFIPQSKKTYQVDGKNNPLNILATVLPQFAVNLQDGQYEELWKAHASERNEIVESVIEGGEDNTVAMDANYDTEKKQIVVTPHIQNTVKPGMYKLTIKVKTVSNKYNTITQDFSWGVLAINTNKGKYKVGETALLGMAVLDENGTTKCIKTGAMKLNTAVVWLTVTSPSGKKYMFSTEDKTIEGGKDCIDRKVTNSPDFLAKMSLTEPGKYTMQMEAETSNGKRSIDDYFTVFEDAPKFEVERVKYPTRIYPRVDYPITIKVYANADYKGKVEDFIPKELTIVNPSENGRVIGDKNFQRVEWNVDWKQGITYNLTYTIHFPPIVPEFYLIGPLRIGEFDEGRGWQIVSDAIFQLVQEAHSTATGTNNVYANFSTGVTSGNLLVMNCYRTNSSSWPNITSWTRAIRNTSGTPRVAQYFRVVTSTIVGTTNFGCLSTSSNGEVAIQIMEFSGNAPSQSVVRDRLGTVRTGRTCNSTSGTSNTTNSFTPYSPDVLLVALSAASTTPRTVVSHTALTGLSVGMYDTDINGGDDGFYGSVGSYDSSYGESIRNPQVALTERILWSGNGTCVIGIVSYNPNVSISQGSFRFFENVDGINPTTPLDAQDTNVTLSSPNIPFRLRLLLDVDSPSGTVLDVGQGAYMLQYAELPATNNCIDGVYEPVATNSAIAYNPNPSLSNLQPISDSGFDPSDNVSPNWYTTVYQNYIQLYDPGDDTVDPAIDPIVVTNNQNPLGDANAGLWDFSLVNKGVSAGTHTYCLMITDSGGSLLDAYSIIPRVTTFNNIDVLIRGGTTIKGGNSGGDTLIR